MSACRTLLALALAIFPVLSARAGLVVNIDQVGNDVVVNFSGSADTRGMIAPTDGVSTLTLRPGNMAFGTSTVNVPTSRFGGISNPSPSPYTGSAILSPSSGSGDRLGILTSINLLVLPRGYVSGTQLLGTNTFNNATLQSLSLTTGTHVWSWGSVANGNADTLVMNIGVTAVPEPSSMVLLSIGAAGLALMRRSRGLFG